MALLADDRRRLDLRTTPRRKRAGAGEDERVTAVMHRYRESRDAGLTFEDIRRIAAGTKTDGGRTPSPSPPRSFR
jgi:hypothetical protein